VNETPTDAGDYVAMLAARLQERFLSGARLPRADGLHVAPCEELKTGRCICTQDAYLGIAQFSRLLYYISTEGYGRKNL
jgi:hypothetical protein